MSRQEALKLANSVIAEKDKLIEILSSGMEIALSQRDSARRLFRGLEDAIEDAIRWHERQYHGRRD